MGRVPHRDPADESSPRPDAAVSVRDGARPGARRLLIAGGLVLALVLVLGGLFVWPRVSSDEAGTPESTEGATASSPGTTPDGTGDAGTEAATTDDVATGDADVVLEDHTVADLDEALAGAGAQTVGAVVVDPQSGEQLYAQNAEQLMLPASNQKILATAAIFNHLDPELRLATTVVEGDEPDTVVLVAGGDTLLAPGDSDPDAVEGRAGVQTLASQTAQRIDDGQIGDHLTVQTDTSVFEGPALNDHWGSADIAAGEVGPIAPLAFASHAVVGPDGQPTEDHDDAAAETVAETFASALEAEIAERTGRSISVQVGGSVDTGADPLQASEQSSSGTELARVESATVQEQARVMMENSDNRLAESLCRMAAVGAGEPGSVEGARTAMSQAITEILGRDPVAEDDVVLSDCAGVSAANSVSAEVLAGILTASAEDPDGSAGDIVSTLPTAGEDGTLTDRFQAPDEEAGLGNVRAKTGTLRVVTALSGQASTGDGDTLIAVVLLNGTNDVDDARHATDRFFAVLAES